MNADRQKAMLRGTLVHRLLQALPDIAPDAARRCDPRATSRAPRSDFSAAEHEQIAAQVNAVLGDSRFAELFAPGSRAEVPIVGRLTRDGRTFRVSGQVDRLVVTGDAVLIADYKTNRPGAAPARGCARLRHAARALSRGPGQALSGARDPRRFAVDAVPDLMALSPQVLDEALARFTPA